MQLSEGRATSQLRHLTPHAEVLPHSAAGLLVQALNGEPFPSRVHRTAILNPARIAAYLGPSFHDKHGI